MLVPEANLGPALILGNGPSLNSLDLRKTEGYTTFGMNAAYRYWRQINWWPHYYSCLDVVVGESHRDSIARLIAEADVLGIRQFLLRHSLIKRLGSIRNSDRVVCYERLLADGQIPKLRDVTTGSHTMLWAECLGHSTILLAGVDCDYVERVPGAVLRDGHLVIAERTSNPNYFFDAYQEVGDRYNLPNLMPDFHVRSWRHTAAALAPFTVVVNLNPESKVDAFDFNLSKHDCLKPGTRVSRSSEDDASRAQSKHLRDLARLSRQPLHCSPQDVAFFLRARFNGDKRYPECCWRATFGGRYVDFRIEDLPQEASGHSYLILQMAEHEFRIPTLKPMSPHDERTSNTSALRLRLFRPDRLPQYLQLVQEIYASFGQHRVRGSIARMLMNRLFRLIPWRVRAIDYRGLRARITVLRH